MRVTPDHQQDALERARRPEPAAAPEAIALLETLLAATPVGVAFFDRDLRYARMNEALAQLNGLPIERHLGRTIAELFPALAPALEPVCRHVLDTGEPIVDVETVAISPAAPDDVRHWRGSLHPVRATDEEIIGVLALITDITARKRAEQEREHLLARERAAVRSRDEFLAVAAHELRTPLAAIKGSGQLLARELRSPAPDLAGLRSLAELLDRQLGRLDALFTELLDVSRLRHGQLIVRQQPTDLAELAREVHDRFEHSPHMTPRHTLALEAPTPVVAVVDRERIDQVLTNLVSNALKYSPMGGEARVTVRQEADRAVIAVRDQGLGIAPEARAALFQPFSRGAAIRDTIGGVGLGLYISAQIVERHGGTIEVESAPGQGSAFTVRLPMNGNGAAS
jgi:PAS domain S-box-containing protein